MKTTLKTHPSYRPSLGDPRNVCLTENLIYEDDDYIIEIFAGYSGSDGGSLPRLSWSLLGITPTDGRCIYGFLIHDFLFQTHYLSYLESNKVLARILAIHPSCEDIQQDLINWHVWAYGWIPYLLKSRRTISKTRKFGKVTRKRHLSPAVLI